MRVVIVGCGSMGKRRARGLRKLGFNDIAAVDPREDRRSAIAEQSGVETYADFERAVMGASFAMICVPPHLHAGYLLRCIEARLPAFCESPLTLTLEQADRVIEAAEAAGVFIAPSCTYLHNQIHRRIKEYLDQEAFGRPLAAVSHVGQHVADWHPYEDYRGFYASKRSQGGMCIDMLPHDLHLFTHYFGDVTSLTCMARRRSSEIESDPGACDVYDVLLDTRGGVSMMIHQDVFQRPWGVYRKIMCERGAIEWDWRLLRVCASEGAQSLKEPQWQEVPLAGYNFEDMYVAEIDHALKSLRGDEAYWMPLRQERHILELVLACEKSSNTGKRIDFGV